MAIAQYKRNTSTVISKGQATAFFSKLNKNVPTRTFWDECKRINASINSDAIDIMDNLIDQRIRDGK